VREDGTSGAAPAVVEFTVRPPIWLRPWFLALAAASIVSGGYALHRVRVARLLELERIRLRIAIDLHDDIGTSLSRIAILSEVARRSLSDDSHGADGPLARIAATSREVVDAMSDIVWAINPARDSLDDLIRRIRRFVNDVLASRGIEVRFVAPEGVTQRLGHDVRRQLLLVLKESTTNIARHADCSDVFIELAAADGMLTLVVRDNGRGFDTTAASDGHGLTNMRRRVEELGGTLQIRAAPGGGTELVARVPARPPLRANLRRRYTDR
jgi:signal transduction histidine kinase